jgi:hypothetical protein
MVPSRRLSCCSAILARALCAFVLLVLVSACDRNPVASASCPVLSSEPRPEVLRLTVQGITSGTPPAPLHTDTVRGPITVAVNVGTAALPAGGARVELRVADHVLAAAAVRAAAGADQVALALTADTGAHDAAWARLVPNGSQVLYVDLLAGERAQAGCTPLRIGTLPITLTFANP